MTPFFPEDISKARSNPVSDGELSAQIALARAETVPLRLRSALLARLGSAREVFETSETVLREMGLSQSHARALSRLRAEALSPAGLDALRASGIEVLSLGDTHYPGRLKEIAVPPLVLFAVGDISLLESRAVLAVVGARDMTEYGIKVLEHVIPKLVAAGVTIVSGLAFGIDARAHEICLNAGGKAIAVQAQGVDQAYPQGNHALYKKVVSCGLVLSEFSRAPVYTGPEIFPRRNRIVSGISDGVLVVEARVKSGSLVTAHFALGQNRGVYAVPGDIFREMSRGCLQLIRDGAKPVCEASDIIEELSLSQPFLTADAMVLRTSARVATDIFETPLEKNIFEACRAESKTIDDLIEICAASVHSVVATVTKMSLSGTLIEEKNGGFRSIG